MSSTRVAGTVDQPVPFTVTSTSLDGVIELRLGGELDVAEVALLEAAVADRCSPAPPVVRFHLGDVTFLDIAGLQAITAAYERLAGAGAAVEITAWSPPVVRMIELARSVDLPIAEGFPMPVSLQCRADDAPVEASAVERTES